MTPEPPSPPLPIRAILELVARGELGPAEALDRLRDLPYADLGDLRIDHHRQLRTGVPEVVLAEGKTAEQCARAVAEMLRHGTGPVLVTRADPVRADAVLEVAPGGDYDEVGRVVTARIASAESTVQGRVALAVAGTSDLPVARECAAVLRAFLVDVEVLTDVGVAGLHRLLSEREALDRADVVIAIAGMEGALPTLVAGLVPGPVIGLPTSIGYGVAREGRAALDGMLASCSPGLAVVNIDNGLGAAVAAMRALRLRSRT